MGGSTRAYDDERNGSSRTISDRTGDVADATSDQTETVREPDETLQGVADEPGAKGLEIDA